MSRASFPRPEHSALLREKIEQRLRARPLDLEVAERGLDHYRCRYRFGFRRSSDENWIELPIHFQVAERLETTCSDAKLGRILDSFLDRYFPGTEPGHHRGQGTSI